MRKITIGNLLPQIVISLLALLALVACTQGNERQQAAEPLASQRTAGATVVVPTGAADKPLATEEPGCGPEQVAVYEGGKPANCVPLTTPPPDKMSITKTPSKVAPIVERKIEAVRSAVTTGTSDPSALSDATLHVSAAGEIELAFHAATSVGNAEIEDLEALGARIEAGTAGQELPPAATPGIIQAWLAYNRIEEAAQLSWVVAITPPSYGETD